MFSNGMRYQMTLIFHVQYDEQIKIVKFSNDFVRKIFSFNKIKLKRSDKKCKNEIPSPTLICASPSLTRTPPPLLYSKKTLPAFFRIHKTRKKHSGINSSSFAKFRPHQQVVTKFHVRARKSS